MTVTASTVKQIRDRVTESLVLTENPGIDEYGELPDGEVFT
jgi:hypothetical protein